MKILPKAINGFTTGMKWFAMLVVISMAVLVTLTVILRNVFKAPIVGDYELVELLMVILIAMGLAYAEQINAHVSIGLLVDRFSHRVQDIFDFLAYILILAVCIFVGTVQLTAGIDLMTGFSRSTEILRIPQYPFKLLLGIGFYAWGLQILLKIIYKSILVIKGNSAAVKEG